MYDQPDGSGLSDSLTAEPEFMDDPWEWLMNKLSCCFGRVIDTTPQERELVAMDGYVPLADTPPAPPPSLPQSSSSAPQTYPSLMVTSWARKVLTREEIASMEAFHAALNSGAHDETLATIDALDLDSDSTPGSSINDANFTPSPPRQ